MAATGASTVVTAGSHNGTAFGIVTNYSMSSDASPLPLPEQGKMLPSAIGITAKGIVAVVTYVAGAGQGFIAAGTLGTLSFTIADLTGGATKTASCVKMKCFSCVLNHADRSLASFTAVFICEDSTDAAVPALS